ncbi:MAG: peptidase, partial [Anaerococcus sp.]|nr:peptidase [Anaerococcus sp.]
MNKKLIALALAGTFAFAGCGNNADKKTEDTKEDTKVTEPAETEDTKDTTVTEPEETTDTTEDKD